MARDQPPCWMSRRRFCWTSLGILVAPDIAIAQGSKVARRIGVLEPGAPETLEEQRKQAEPLRELGWVEGQNLHVERRYDNGRLDALQPLAEELVRAQVEIIVTGGTAATLAAKRATTTIPIVFRAAGDAVFLGLVASLARPGGNVTGYSLAMPELAAKYLSLLKEVMPRLQRIGVMWQAANPYYPAVREQFERACRSLGLAPIVAEIGAEGEVGALIAHLVRQRAQALVLLSDTFVWGHRSEIVAAATKRGLLTMGDVPEFVTEAGALISYSWSQVEEDRRRAEYIDRILRGAKPADLPVQQPTKFVLVVNLKTARALGIAVSQSLLLRADEVIQ